MAEFRDDNGVIRKKIRWSTNKRKGKGRKWKTTWVVVKGTEGAARPLSEIK